ncbi:hypothetical protein CK203_011227 [Vitis vinifera]|uniref:Uncharacterized protein n=1 Tax=Vitis vinifera TaxID=29760 RepID=A0A438JZ47_VITVI|nr:hypothetical protein CK203_011227 [Vitis vinifera]
MDSGIEVVEERLNSFTGQLQSECAILERIVYKNKNQHRRCSYFQYLLKVPFLPSFDGLYSLFELKNKGIEKSVRNFRVGRFLKFLVLYLRTLSRVSDIIPLDILKSIQPFEVRRDLKLLQSANLEELLSSCFQVIHGKKPQQKVHLLESIDVA